MTQASGLGAGRSTAIVLFTDLVGSTELRSRVGEKAAEELRQGHDALVVGAVGANRGHVVKNLGDGIMATFTGASDAVGAAVAIQQAIGRYNRSRAVALEVRVGISAGDVVFEGDDCFGTPVIEAARLCAVAAGGQILASELVRGLAHSDGGTFTPVGNLELKGLPEPVAAVQVNWELLAKSSVPLPPFLTDIGRIFVSRDDELGRLGQVWKEATAGELRVALLAGEPGVGKTRLAAELAGRVHDDGATVLAGRCDEDLGVPYQPFVEALRHFVDHTSLVPSRLGRYGGELTRLVPELSERVPDLPDPLRSDPETDRYRLFDAVAAWLAVASTEEPLLFVLDDLQWATKPTLLLLRHVVHAASGRVLILGTYRDTELTHDHPLAELVADLRRQGHVERLSLSGLDDLGVRAFVEQAAGTTLDEDGLALSRAIHEETEGNPFFVREVLRHLAETGGVERRQGAWTTRLPADQLAIPDGVRDVVGRRLSRLSDDANQTLRVAAVVGAEFELAVVRAAGELGEDALLAAVEEAAAARLVNEASATRFRFSHALVRATLYESLTAARQVMLHRRVAEAIETIHRSSLDDHVPALAYHWAKASAPVTDPTKAVDYARRAGDRALAQLAHDEAAAYYRSALDLLDAAGSPGDDPRRPELLISRGEAQRRAGDADHRETLLDAARLARRQGDAKALGRAALANSRGMFSSAVGTVDADRVGALEAALEELEPGDSPMRARLLATLGQEIMYLGDRERRVALSDEALAIARRVGDAATVAEVLLLRYYTVAAPNTLDERWASTEELLALADLLGDAGTRSRALALRFRVAMEAADVEEADRCLRANENLAIELRQPTLRWYVTVQQAARTLLGGRLAEGERLAFEASETGRAAGQPDAPTVLVWQQDLIHFEQGRLGEYVEVLSRTTLDLPGLPGLRALLAEAYCELRRLEEAGATFEALARADFATIPFDSVWLRALTACALVCSELGDASRAAVLYGLLSPYADQLPTFSFGTVTACVSYYLGLLLTSLERFEEAEARFVAAAGLHARIGAPTWLARTHLGWARMLLGRAAAGDGERAQDLLRQALATARELGLPNVERNAVELLSSQ